MFEEPINFFEILNIKTFGPTLIFKIEFFHYSLHFFVILIMNINDKYVLEMLNKFIATDRLNKAQILQMVHLVSISNDINDLKENLKWESFKSLQ